MLRNLILIVLICISVSATAQNDTTINAYAAVTSASNVLCALPDIKVDQTVGFKVGDDVLIIQMKGADFDSSNTPNFGQISNWNSAGHYEINKIGAINGNTITLSYVLTRTYNFTAKGKVQLVKVPRFKTYAINKEHTCMPWTNNKGGVFAIIVEDHLVMNNNINVSGKGFRGGTTSPLYHTQYIKNTSDYYYPSNQYNCAMKGEGIVEVTTSKIFGRGTLYNGAGGGNSTNAGGGGGGNGGTGGRGGDEWVGSNPSMPYGGVGGRPFAYTPASNKLYLGGGGGAGHANDAYIAPGGNGGGLVLIIADTITGNTKSIFADGVDGMHCLPAVRGGTCNDGFGGGGAGGTVFITSNSTAQLNVFARGGHGANITAIHTYGPHGPGGGGGGGTVLTNSVNIMTSLTTDVSGGAAGMFTVTPGNTVTNWGTQPGVKGVTVMGFLPIIDTSKPQTIVVNAIIKDSGMSCLGHFITVVPSSTLTGMQWNFGDGTTGTGNPVTHKYAAPGTYNITLTGTDQYGCPHTFNHTITVVPNQVNSTIKDSSMSCLEHLLTAVTSSALTGIQWSFGDGGTGTGNPVIHKYTTPGNYIISFTGNDIYGCPHTFHQTITVEQSQLNVTINSDSIACHHLSFIAASASSISSLRWNFGDGSTATGDSVTHIYKRGGNFKVTLTVTDSIGCTHTFDYEDSLNSTIPLYVSNDTTICMESKIQIIASGATTYQWSPVTGIENPGIGGPYIMPGKNITYYVEGIDENGCKGNDSVRIEVFPSGTIHVSSDYPDVNCDRESVQLFASGAANYYWEPADHFTNNRSSMPVVSPKRGTKYVVTGTDANGCPVFGSIDIFNNKELRIFAPSAFSPNGDGLNDVYHIIPICDFTLEQLNIYNRWGERVYVGRDINDGWDGFYKGTLQGIGSFVYYVTGRSDEGNPVTLTGDFTLIK